MCGGRLVRVWISLALVSLLEISAEPLRAAGEDVDAIVKRGVDLRKEGKDREALAEFQRAAKIARTPRVAGQIGLAEMALGTWLPAEEHLREALDHADDAWVRKNRTILEKALATMATHLGALDIWGTPEGAEVIADGRLVGTLPFAKPVRLTAGVVTVTIQARGYQPVTRAVQVTPQQLTRENVDLLPPPAPTINLSAEQTPTTRGLTPKPSKAGETVIFQRDSSLSAVEPREKRPLVKRWWFWTIIGAAVAGGVVLTVRAISNRDQIPACPTGVFCSRD
jgi:hypothetical protein